MRPIPLLLGCTLGCLFGFCFRNTYCNTWQFYGMRVGNSLDVDRNKEENGQIMRYVAIINERVSNQ